MGGGRRAVRGGCKAAVRYAVIDIGSVAARLQIAALSEGKLLTEVFTRIPLGLGGGVFGGAGGGGEDGGGEDGGAARAAGVISAPQRRRLFSALAGMRQLIDSMKPCRYSAVATAALRACANRAQVVAGARRHCGVNIRVLSGKAEAAIIGVYAAAHFAGGAEKSVMNVDVGGGSTDCVLVTGGLARAAQTFMLGTARAGGGAAAEKARCAAWLRAQVSREDIGGGGVLLAASGGSAYQLRQCCGELTARRMAHFQRGVAGLSAAAVAAKYDMSPDRAAHTMDAIDLYQLLLKNSGSAKITPIRGGLAEAIIWQKLGAPVLCPGLNN